METIKCKSCGAVQEVSSNDTTCSFCGGIIEMQSSKDFYKETISGETGNLMAMADTAIDATNWEEALQFYNRVLEKDITNSDAWLGKGIAIVYTSKIGELKTTEAIAYWKNAIKHSSNKEAIGKRVAKEINTVVSQHEIRVAKLQEFKEETLSFYQQKAFKEAYLYVISRIMTRVRERLNSGLNSTYHVVVNNFYVSRFTEYNPK